MWVLYAFASAFFAGITSILAKIGIKNVNSHLATALRTIVILLFSWLMVLIVGSLSSIHHLSMMTWVFLILSGLATGLSWLCYFKALQLGNVNKVTPIDKSSTLLTMIFAMIFLGESITILKILSLICIGIGTYLMIDKKENVIEVKDNQWLIYALGSAVFASLTAILGKVGIQGVESNLGTAIRTVVVLLMAWLVVFVTGKQKQLKVIDKTSWLFILFSGITTGLSWLCYYKALQDGQASIVVPIDKLSIVITIFFSYFFLKEKLSVRSLIGFIGIIVGTLLLLI